MIREWLLWIFFCSIVLICEGNTHSSCVLKETCAACIRTVGCIWCSSPKNLTSSSSDSFTRCVHADHQLPDWCPLEDITNPITYFTVLDDKLLTAGSTNEEPVQIRPQKIRVVLRQGESVSVPIQYQQAVGYPVDLYYLMDLSASMEDDLETISTLGSKLTSAMKTITNNFHIGFGSFIDKPELPYVNTIPAKLQKPCLLQKDKTPCAPVYAFKNQMALTNESESFSKQVSEAPVSGNLDHPEGGLDALMQVMVCTSMINWRERARKLLIFSTDAGFHMAGDGKLAGIVEPNDEKCHLNGDGFYTHSLSYDFPSISQINKIAKEKNINIIFAVPQKQMKLYEMLKDYIYGASYAMLSKDSKNIVSLLLAEYDKLVDSITLTDNSGGSIEIQYYSNCLGSEVTKTNECGGLKGRPQVNFTAIIKAVSCPENTNEWNTTIKIKPKTLNENLVIDLQIICDCKCDQPEHPRFEAHSQSCNVNGNLQCGVCSCDSGRYGRFCECDGDKARTLSGDLSRCHSDNITEVCSDRGFCKCGKCDCVKRTNPEEVIYGTYCECDNFSCRRNGGLLCSGLDRGRCDCGQCVCRSGWSGPACECRETNATCIAPNSKDVCSGHGTCVCGSCQCSMQEKVRYSGQYCEECPHCTETRCDELRHCVECQVHKSGLYSESECIAKCTDFEVKIVDTIEAPKESEEDTTERICRLPDNVGCTIVFKYSYEDDNKSLRIYGQKDKECAPEIDIMAVVFGVVGSTVLAGLILLIIWKILTTIHDRREYVKFEKEKSMAKWNPEENPLYKPSTTTFNNPTFRPN